MLGAPEQNPGWGPMRACSLFNPDPEALCWPLIHPQVEYPLLQRAIGSEGDNLSFSFQRTLCLSIPTLWSREPSHPTSGMPVRSQPCRHVPSCLSPPTAHPVCVCIEAFQLTRLPLPCRILIQFKLILISLSTIFLPWSIDENKNWRRTKEPSADFHFNIKAFSS